MDRRWFLKISAEGLSLFLILIFSVMTLLTGCTLRERLKERQKAEADGQAGRQGNQKGSCRKETAGVAEGADAARSGTRAFYDLR